MSAMDELLASGAPPIVAILRGVRPDEVGAIGRALVNAGVRLIEVPLNSPDPFDGIAALAAAVSADALVGGGTVLDVTDVDKVRAAGGHLIVSPNTDAGVIARAVALGLEPMPGFMTPSEAFAAIRAGARRLKLFPAGALGMAHLKAVREVLPRAVVVWTVGGAGASNLAEWIGAGAAGIGVGGSLYKPGDSAQMVGERAAALVAAWAAVRSV
jgi:2-dehydro-3-deoxyphosphogalactonate aldolase